MKSILIVALLTVSVFASDARRQGQVMNELEVSTKATLYENSAENFFRQGFLTMEGIDTIQDTHKAIELYKKSSRIGYRMAQESLADEYCSGDKIKQDFKQCSYWANRADYKYLWNKYELWNYMPHGAKQLNKEFN